MRADVVLHGEMVTERRQGLRLVGHRGGAASEYGHLRQPLAHRLDELEAPGVQRVPLPLGRIDDGNVVSLVLGSRSPDEVGARHPVSRRAAEEPVVGGLLVVPLRMRQSPWRLTGQHVPELSGEAAAIGLDRGRLGRDEDGLVRRAGQCFAGAFARLYMGRRHVVVDHQPFIVRGVAIEQELASLPATVFMGEVTPPLARVQAAEELDSDRVRCRRIAHGRSPRLCDNTALDDGGRRSSIMQCRERGLIHA